MLTLNITCGGFMSKLQQVFKYLMSFQLLDSPKDYDFYLKDLAFYEKSSLETIYSDVSKVNNDFYNVLKKKSS